MARNDEKKSVRCSFCGKPQSLVNRLVAGNGVYICDECVRLCMSIIDEGYQPESVSTAQVTLRRDQLPKPAEMRATLDKLKEKGIQNILAMRGDLGSEETKDFKYASELIKFINENYSFRIFAACYPEKHLEAYSMEEDLEHLRAKCECGVSVLISQLFFDNASFYSFRERARKLGVAAPIEAGIMPITSPTQIGRMVSMCGASVPDGVQKIIRAYGHNSMAMREAGIAYATNQIIDLLAEGVDGIHLYTMNQPDIAKRICENIRGVLYSLRVKRG